MPAKRKNYRRDRPRIRKVLPPPAEIDLEAVAEKCRYVGSPYHRTIRIGGVPPRRNKPGKTSCPKNLQQNQSLVQRWLQEAIRRGNFGKFDQGLPRVVWHEEDGKLFEARSSGRGSCEYHGYPLAPHDTVIGIK